MGKNSQLEDYIPKELKKQIEIQAIGNRHFEEVYRVAKWGKLEERVFLSTYAEILEGYIENGEKFDKSDIGTYSTSVYTERRNCDKFINLLKRKRRLRKLYPYPIVIKGKTSCGCVQKTSDRNEEYEDTSHVDWWIYKDKKAIAMKNFTICE